jgi:hypothetical protein
VGWVGVEVKFEVGWVREFKNLNLVKFRVQG